MEIVADRFIKRAGTAEERIALRREATALQICAHPGVVPLLSVEGGDPPDALVFARLSGGSLAERDDRSLGGLVGWGAAVASTLADLHGIGWVHGALSPDHVIFDADGRPVLCGLRRAEAPADGSVMARAVAADVAGLATMLLERLPAGSDRRLVRLLASVAGQGSNGRARARLLVPTVGGRRPARELARRLVELVPEARSGVGEQPPLDEPVGAVRAARRRRLVWVAGIAAVSVAAAIPLAVSGLAGRRRSPLTPAPEPIHLSVSDRYVLSGPPGAQLLTVIGRWDCGTARPAVVDLRTGWIWVFDHWPARGAADAGRVVGHVPRPAGLAVRTSVIGCEQLVALEGSGQMTVIAVPAGP